MPAFLASFPIDLSHHTLLSGKLEVFGTLPGVHGICHEILCLYSFAGIISFFGKLVFSSLLAAVHS